MNLNFTLNLCSFEVYYVNIVQNQENITGAIIAIFANLAPSRFLNLLGTSTLSTSKEQKFYVELRFKQKKNDSIMKTLRKMKFSRLLYYTLVGYVLKLLSDTFRRF